MLDTFGKTGRLSCLGLYWCVLFAFLALRSGNCAQIVGLSFARFIAYRVLGCLGASRSHSECGISERVGKVSLGFYLLPCLSHLGFLGNVGVEFQRRSAE